MKLFVLFGCLFTVASCRVSVHDCFHDATPQASHVVVECKLLVDKTVKEFKDDILARMTPEDNEECILGVFDQYNITELFLKGLEQHIRTGRPSKIAYETDVDESTFAFFKSAKVLCTADSTFRAGFDEFFDQSHKVPSEDDAEERCLKKYFIDKGIINPLEYNIDVASIHAVNCEQTIKNLEDSFNVRDDDDDHNTFFGLSAVKAFKCVTNKYAEEKTLQKIHSIQTLIKLDLTDAQKAKLKNDNVKWMTSSVRFLLECISEI